MAKAIDKRTKAGGNDNKKEVLYSFIYLGK